MSVVALGPSECRRNTLCATHRRLGAVGQLDAGGGWHCLVSGCGARTSSGLPEEVNRCATRGVVHAGQSPISRHNGRRVAWSMRTACASHSVQHSPLFDGDVLSFAFQFLASAQWFHRRVEAGTFEFCSTGADTWQFVGMRLLVARSWLVAVMGPALSRCLSGPPLLMPGFPLTC